MLTIRDETFGGLFPFTPHYYSHHGLEMHYVDGGMQDPVIPPSILHRWQQLYPHATTHEIEDASHFLQEDAPERVVPWIETFLKTNP